MNELKASNLRWRGQTAFPRTLIAILVILILVFGGALACGSAEEEEPPAEEPPAPEPMEPEVEDEGGEEEEEPEEGGPAEGEILNPLTGLWHPEELVARRILAVAIDNSPRARPHIGLAEADVLFELLVEGGATRFIAMFLGEDPEVVGPVRSARHYFVDLATALDALLVHCGGSPQALRQIAESSLGSLDDLRGRGNFFRQPSPGVPYEHTLFTRIPENRVQVDSRGLGRAEVPNPPWAYPGRREEPGISGQSGQEMTGLTVKFPPGYESYSTSYQYDEESDRYLRFLGGEPHADRETGEQLGFENVVILWAATKPIPGDRYGRLDIDTKGSGEALIITGGRGYSGLWSGEDGFSLSGPRGGDVRLTPGKTWIAFLPLDTGVEVEGLQP